MFYRGNFTQRVAGGLTGAVTEANDGQGHSVAVTSNSEAYASGKPIFPALT